MNARGFKHCCGAVEMGSLDGCTLEGIEAQLQKIRDGDFDDSYPFLHGKPGFVIATTSSDNTEGVVKAVKKAKFRVLARFTNPRSGRQVSLWGRKL